MFSLSVQLSLLRYLDTQHSVSLCYIDTSI